MDKLVLIDGHSILNRAFYGVPDLTNSEGLHTNAVYGFLNILFKILEEEQADGLAVAFDRKEPTFRHAMYQEYKGTRKPMPEELRQQVPLMQEVLAAMEIPVITLAGYEADDILGTLGKRAAAAGTEVSIVSGDRDLLQLADAHIKIRIPKTSRGTTEIHDYYPEDVKREYQVTPEEFIDVKALMGDASDNIPGVPSIGEKTATALIAAYGSLENVYAHLEEVRPPRAKKALEEHRDLAWMSRDLARIHTDCPVECSFEAMKIKSLYTPEAYGYMKRLEFKSILTRFDQAVKEQPAVEEGFHIIRDLAQAEHVFAMAKQAECAGLQLAFREDVLEAAAVCLDGREAFCVPAGGFLTGAWIAGHAAEIVEKAGRTVTLGLKQELPFLQADYGSRAADAQIAAYLLNPLKDTYEYDDLARDYLGESLPSQPDLLGKRTPGQAFAEEADAAAVCLCYMVYTARKAWAELEKRLKETDMWKLYQDVEMPLVYSLYHMEQAGIRVEKETLKAYGNRLKEQIGSLEQEIYQLAGETFNINSPKQLGEVLFGRMQLPHGKKTKTGYSTAADVLEKLAPEYPVVQKILDYRQLTKLNSTYAEGLYGFIREDGRIHGTFNQTITATGRISSTEPNLQNIPVRMELGREIRKVFVPEEGYTFTDADYSQIELRILAHMSGDRKLIEAYQNAQDIHAITASEVFHTPLSQVTPLQRRNAKAVNFGIVYGISAFGLSEDLSITRQEAMAYIEQYFRTYPQVKEFLDRQVQEGKEQGFVTSLFGRRRPIPELKSANFMQRSFGERVAMNSPIQGTAADIMKIAMIAVDQELRRRQMKSRVVLQVHDELLVETWKEETDQVLEILTEKMKHAADLKVSLEVEAHTGDTWFDAK